MSSDWGATEAGYVPLFDRLIDDDVYRRGETRPRRTLNRNGLIESVGRELLRLFTTRCTVTGDVALSRPRTVLDYGVPDLDWGGQATVAEQHQRIARLLRETVMAFEPRLANVRIEVHETAERSGVLTVLVKAHLITTTAREPISFSLPLGSGTTFDGS